MESYIQVRSNVVVEPIDEMWNADKRLEIMNDSIVFYSLQLQI